MKLWILPALLVSTAVSFTAPPSVMMASKQQRQQQQQQPATVVYSSPEDSRRRFLGSSASVASWFVGCNMLGWPAVLPASAAVVDYKAVAADIKQLVAADPDKVRSGGARLRIENAQQYCRFFFSFFDFRYHF